MLYENKKGSDKPETPDTTPIKITPLAEDFKEDLRD